MVAEPALAGEVLGEPVAKPAQLGRFFSLLTQLARPMEGVEIGQTMVTRRLEMKGRALRFLSILLGPTLLAVRYGHEISDVMFERR